MTIRRPFSAADLPVRNGRAYHLDLAPAELAGNVIIVGDPDRVPLLADEFLGDREADRFHRGFRSITGRVRDTGERVSIVTSGIGTPSLEIILTELVALNEVDLRTRRRKAWVTPLTIIRLGTCGGLQPEPKLGTLIVTDYVVGLDNTGLFYDIPAPDPHCRMIEERVRKVLSSVALTNARFQGKIFPYAARAHPEVRVALEREALHLGVPCRRGVTVSSASFFAGEGREVAPVPVTLRDMDGALAAMDTGIPGLVIESLEMEASFLLHFLGGLGYRAGVACVLIDKRADGTFLTDYRDHILDAARVVLQAFHTLPPARPAATRN
jgi:uridine phosphorylase